MAGVHKFSRSDVKILDARRVTRSKFHAEDPQILSVILQNLVARDLCTPALFYTTNY
jgi:hypothetical protein